MEKTSPGGRRLAERQTDEGSVEELKNGGVLDEELAVVECEV